MNSIVKFLVISSSGLSGCYKHIIFLTLETLGFINLWNRFTKPSYSTQPIHWNRLITMNCGVFCKYFSKAHKKGK